MSSVSKIENQIPSDSLKSRLCRMGNVLEVVTCDNWSKGSPCRKIDKEHYVDIRDGEIKEYNCSQNRGENLHGIRQTLNRIRALINTNVVNPQNCLWVTLTYRQEKGKPMTDTDRLRTDYEKFWKRFCYWCKNEGHSKPEYISVIEPQNSGAWHVHAFFIWQTKAPYVANNEVMEKLWRQGFTSTKQVFNCDNVGAYFSAYLGDIPLDELEGHQADYRIIDKKIDGKNKKIVKGGRLHLYPSGMNIVRTSRGIKKPEFDYMTYGEAKKKVSAATETFSQSYEITDDNGRKLNTITKTYYNLKRKQ